MKTVKAKELVTGEKALALRKKLGMNQSEFWGAIDVTQSAASRYESGRKLPRQVALLLDLTYGKRPIKTLAALRNVSIDQVKVLD